MSERTEPIQPCASCRTTPSATSRRSRMVGGTPNVLVVPESVPVSTLREFVAWAKANPDKLAYGSSGPGTLTHLAMEQFKIAAGLPDITHIAYRGIGPAFTDILGGSTQAMLPGLAAALPHIKGRQDEGARGNGHAQASAAARRPHVRGVGLSRLRRRAVVRHRRSGRTCRQSIVQQLNDDINKALASPELARTAVRRGARTDADDARRSSANIYKTTSPSGRSSPRRATST